MRANRMKRNVMPIRHCETFRSGVTARERRSANKEKRLLQGIGSLSTLHGLQRRKDHRPRHVSRPHINMTDPITIAGPVLAIVVGVIQGAGRIRSRLWTRLEAIFGGLAPLSECVQGARTRRAGSLLMTGGAGALMTVDRCRLRGELTSILQANASRASRRYLDPANPFGWSDSD